jgi:isoleucyl-tRNA synthetase
MNDLSTWYVRRSRDRIKDGDIEALETLYFVLVELTKLMAPFFPFISEKAYEILDVARFSKLESVHFEIIDFKLENLTSEEKELLEKMSKDREIISNTLALRTNSKISLRQALNQVYLSEKVSFEEIFKEELNIKNIIYTQREFQTEFSNEDRSIILDTYLTQELLDEGKVREFIRKIQDMRKNHKLNISDKIKLFYSETDISSLLVEKNREIFTKKLNAIEFEVADESSILPL